MGNVRFLLQQDIEIAQQNTKSAAEAARYLNVSYKTYKRYAKLYGIFEQHKNKRGKGIPKGRCVTPKKRLIDSLRNGDKKSYTKQAVKNALIQSKHCPEMCQLCGYEGRRFNDKKMPLVLDFIDGDETNYKLENLRLICFNCFFITVGSLTGKRKKFITLT